MLGSLPSSLISYLTDLNPSVWFIPQEVWEIRGADFTLSPVYPAAQSLLGERGVSLRFPRFIKVRDDKGIEQATSSEQLASMYEKQSEGGGGKIGDGEE
jgi:DNA ligase 1